MSTLWFENMMIAELGQEGNRPTLHSSYGPTGYYNELSNGVNFSWYNMDGGSLFGGGGTFYQSYYNGLYVNGIAFIQFLDNPHVDQHQILTKYSTIEYKSRAGKDSDTKVTVPIEPIPFLLNPIITGIRLVTDQPTEFTDYILRVYVIPGTLI